jgi:hypothetical protein
MKALNKSHLYVLIICFISFSNFSFGFLDVRDGIPQKLKIEIKDINNKTDKAKKQMFNILLGFKKNIVKIDLYDTSNLKNLKNEYNKNFYVLDSFIKKYPNTKSALTAKLLIGTYSLLSNYYSLNDNKINKIYLNCGNLIFDEIIEEFPESWQAQIALLIKLVPIMDNTKKTINLNEMQIEELISKANFIDNCNDSEFKMYKYLICNGDEDIYLSPISPLVYMRIADYYISICKFDKELTIYKRLIKLFPESEYILDIKNRIKRNNNKLRD